MTEGTIAGGGTTLGIQNSSTGADRHGSPGRNTSIARLLFFAGGIYIFFLSWGILQERITTVEYYADVSDGPSAANKGPNANGVGHSKFKFFIFLNLCQCIGAVILSYAFLYVRGHGIGRTTRPLLRDYMKVALSSSLASPFGYESLRHINYPTMVLGKSCKLIPVMLMNFLVYRRKFETYKYLSVAFITAGVAGFMLFEPRQSSKVVANSLYGLLLLTVNLLIDGATNSWQDQIFFKYKIRSQQMMFFMNLFSAVFMLGWLLLPWNTELASALAFAKKFPSIWVDILAFCLCGTLGQLFIFLTLENFGSLTLVTITVTRKLFTILMSLFWFDHRLNPSQWGCVLMVFVALILESFYKRPLSKIKPK